MWPETQKQMFHAITECSPSIRNHIQKSLDQNSSQFHITQYFFPWFCQHVFLVFQCFVDFLNRLVDVLERFWNHEGLCLCHFDRGLVLRNTKQKQKNTTDRRRQKTSRGVLKDEATQREDAQESLRRSSRRDSALIQRTMRHDHRLAFSKLLSRSTLPRQWAQSQRTEEAWNLPLIVLGTCCWLGKQSFVIHVGIRGGRSPFSCGSKRSRLFLVVRLTFFPNSTTKPDWWLALSGNVAKHLFDVCWRVTVVSMPVVVHKMSMCQHTNITLPTEIN